MTSLIQQYIDKGWGLIPVRPKGHINEKTGENDEKAPFVQWSEFKSSENNKPSENQILRWLANWDNADWAVLTGYDNLVLVDVDDPNLYDLYLSKQFPHCVMRTPSGGISFLIRSMVIPKSITRLNGIALDLKGVNGYAILPSRDLSPKEIEEEEEEEKAGTRNEFIRHWINNDEPDEIDDIEKHLSQIMPKVVPDVKQGKGVPTAIQWAREHNLSIAYDGGRYLQVLCPNHDDKVASMSIYADGYFCHSCKKSGGLFSLIKTYTNLTDAEIFEQYKGIKKQKRTMTDDVISLVEENVTLIKDHNNNSFFKLSDISDIGINLLPINSKITRYWVTRLAENALDKLPPASVLNYVVDYFCGKCMSVGEKTKIYRRIGGNQKEITYDLGNNTFVKITPEAMGIFPDTNLTFIKETNIGVQVVPNKKRRENVLKIFRIINVKDHAQKILLLTWMVTALLPWAQTPILLLCGTRGSGKSFMGRILKRTLDPVEGNSSELLVNKPRDLNYLIGLLSHNAVAVLDNISKIDRETSDILCNVVTGGVIPTRELYTTNDQVLIDIRSKLIITAINSQIFDSGSGDLAERTISIEISRPEDSYLSEEDLVEEYEKCRSEIFGSLLSLVQGYIKEGLPKKGETSGFRLTTYASVGKYISKALGMKTTFDAAYKINQIGLSTNTLEVEPVTDFFIWFAKNFGDKDFNNTRGLGIATDYLFSKFFNEWMSDGGKFGNDRKYPSSANALLTRLKRIEPDLKKIYSISIENKGIHKGKKWLKIKYNGIDDDDDDDNNYEEEEEEEWLKTESGGEKQTKIVKDEEGW